MKKAIGIVAAIALLVFGAGQYVNWSNRDLAELSKARRAALAELRPLLLRYKADSGSFPQTLEQLVPAYLPQIPAVFKDEPNAEPVKRIRYEVREGNARISYHLIRGPDSTEVFDVTSNSFARDK